MIRIYRTLEEFKEGRIKSKYIWVGLGTSHNEIRYKNSNHPAFSWDIIEFSNGNVSNPQ